MTSPGSSPSVFESTQSQIIAVEKRIAEVQQEIVEVAASVKAVQGQVVDVGAKIENTQDSLGKANLSPKENKIQMMILKSLMKEKGKLMDEKKSLMKMEELLMKKEELLMDEKKSLMKKEELLMGEKKILQEAMETMYVQEHNKWTRDGQTVMTAGPSKFCLGQDFAKVRTALGSYVVDKSTFISEFLPTPYVVFRRPRRFGKSLFLSMLKYFFYGATGLFKGMAVYEQTIHFNMRFVWCPSDPSKHNWPPVPVVHLDFSSLKGCTTANEFSAELVGLLAAVGKENKCHLDLSKSPCVVLRDLVTGLASQPLNEHKKVVVLIDEYDAPLNERASDDVSTDILNVYKRFFSELKSLDRDICFAYVTGITSYAMAGIYSGANNFLDLTHSATFESMCAVTEEEFRSAVNATRPHDPAMGPEEMKSMKEQYNGYSWDLEQRGTGERRTLFNPFFVAMYCNSGKVDDYWGQTTSASLVAKFPAIVSIDLDAQSGTAIRRSMLKMPWFPSDNSLQDCVRNLLEAGYFTVVDVTNDAPSSAAEFVFPPDANVKLGVPNQQIRNLFKSNYLSSLFPPNFRDLPAHQACKAALYDGDIVAFFERLNDYFHSIPYQLTSGFDKEHAWHVFAFTVLSSMGLGSDLVAEDTCQRGRSDIVIFVKGVIFVVELKVGTSKGEKTGPLEKQARGAIEQIQCKSYLKSVFVSSRLQRATKVVLVGVVANIAEGKKGYAMIATKEVSPFNASMSAQGSEVELHKIR